MFLALFHFFYQSLDSPDEFPGCIVGNYGLCDMRLGLVRRPSRASHFSRRASPHFPQSLTPPPSRESNFVPEIAIVVFNSKILGSEDLLYSLARSETSFVKSLSGSLRGGSDSDIHTRTHYTHSPTVAVHRLG